MFKNALFTFLLLAVAPVFGQIPDAQWTDGVFNGRWWENTPNLTVRISYLVGIIHGLSKADSESTCYKLVVPNGLTFGEMAKAIDAVYQEPLNGRIPVMAALQIVKAKAEGGDSEAVERITRVWRKGYAEVKPAIPEVTKQ